ncbi:peptide ABC transporter substrate-binding protein, partial [bacterium]
AQRQAEDVRQSFDRALSPALASPVATTYLGDIKNAKSVASGKADSLVHLEVATPDPRTVVITLEKPFGAFLGKLTYPSAAIVDITATGPLEITKPAQAIGTGPFRLASYESDRKVTLEANPGYWGLAPKLKGIEFAVVRDGATRLNLYRQGALDLLTLDRADIKGVSADGTLGKQVRYVERPSVYYLLLNPKQYAPFARPEVRRAFTMALDRTRLAREVLGSLEPADRWVPPSILPRTKGAATVPAFNPAAARAELAKAGIKGESLPPLTLCYRADNADARAVAETVTSDLKTALGVTVEPRAMDWGGLLKARNRAELPCAYLNWTADYVDPENFLSTLLRSDAGVNFDRWTSAEFDRLTTEADASADPAGREDLYRRAEDVVVRELPRMPLYFGRDAVLVSPRVKGLRTNALGTMIHLATSVEG